PHSAVPPGNLRGRDLRLARSENGGRASLVLARLLFREDVESRLSDHLVCGEPEGGEKGPAGHHEAAVLVYGPDRRRGVLEELLEALLARPDGFLREASLVVLLPELGDQPRVLERDGRLRREDLQDAEPFAGEDVSRMAVLEVEHAEQLRLPED